MLQDEADEEVIELLLPEGKMEYIRLEDPDIIQALLLHPPACLSGGTVCGKTQGKHENQVPCP